MELVPHNKNGAGRPKGSPNKSTEQIKSFFAMILASQEGKFLDALDRVHQESPGKYLDILTKLSAKFVPDLSRTELTGENGEMLTPIQVFIPADKKSEQRPVDE